MSQLFFFKVLSIVQTHLHFHFESNEQQQIPNWSGPEYLFTDRI